MIATASGHSFFYQMIIIQLSLISIAGRKQSINVFAVSSPLPPFPYLLPYLLPSSPLSPLRSWGSNKQLHVCTVDIATTLPPYLWSQ